MRSVPTPLRRVAALLALGLLLALPATAEIYRWTDDQGGEHFTQDLSRVPADQRFRARNEASTRVERRRLQTYSSPDAGAAQARRPRASGQTLRIPFEPDGTVMRVQALLNDSVAVPFLVDTGASGISIPQWVADRLGLRIGPATEWIRIQTANGLVVRPVVLLESVSVGDARVHNLPATVTPSLEFGLLGGTFFNNFVYRVDTAAGVISLTPNASVRGGLSEGQWRARFQELHQALARLDAYSQRLPETRSLRQGELARRRSALVQEIEALEQQANQLGVPQAWR